MESEYLLFYTESMIVCIIIFGIMLLHDLVNGNRAEQRIRFDYVLMAHMLYFACDDIWAAVIAGAVPRTVFSVGAINLVLLFLLSLVGKTWFQFTAAMTNMPGRNTTAGKLIINTPMVLDTLIVFAGSLMAPAVWFTEDLNTSLLYNVFFLSASLIYVFSSVIYAMAQAFRKENYLNRRFLFFMGIYPVSVVAAGLVQMTFLNAPIFCYSSTIMMIIFYIIAQDRQISTDPLTRLNNRGQLARYTALDSAIHKEDVRTFVIMTDIDDFKQINDMHGHAEGDRALLIVADALRHAAEIEKIPPFLGRYGGDEFILIAYKEPPETDTESLLEHISCEVDARCTEENLPYMISLSFGVEQISWDDGFLDAMKRADRKLYRSKWQKKHAVK